MLTEISALKNPVQAYSWGSKSVLQDLLKRQDQGGPMAELWMGAHPKAPSLVWVHGSWQSLEEVIQADPEPVLGRMVAQRFSNKLPFLFKVLAAERPLSIQAHPNLEQACRGFEKEQGLGIPLSAANRNYRDKNHKPELLCALSPFLALKGFRPVPEILSLLERVSGELLDHELTSLRETRGEVTLREFFRSFMSLDESRRLRLAKNAIERVKGLVNEDRAFEWVVRLNRDFPGDIGIFFPLILNLIRLRPGDAIYLPSGELHAYLEGVGVEVMANSDNVLRGGLTSKHVNVSELLSIVNFGEPAIEPIIPVRLGPCQVWYTAPVQEFCLSVISVREGKVFLSPRDRGVEILLCLKGKARIESLKSGRPISLEEGSSVIVPAAASPYRVMGNATIYKASVPLS